MGFFTNLVASAGALYGLSSLANKQSHNNAEEAFKNQMYGSKELARYNAYEIPSIAMEGYRKAGINPIIAYGGLSSSSMPSVSAHPAQVHSPDFGDVLSFTSAKREFELRKSVAMREQKREDLNSAAQRRLIDARVKDIESLAAHRKREVDSRYSWMFGIPGFFQSRFPNLFTGGNTGKDQSPPSSTKEKIVQRMREIAKADPEELFPEYTKDRVPYKERLRLSLEPVFSSARRLMDYSTTPWYNGYDWNSSVARKRARMRRYEQDRKELKK